MTDQDWLSTLLKEVVPEPPPRPDRASTARGRARRARRRRSVLVASAVAAVIIGGLAGVRVATDPRPPITGSPAPATGQQDCTGPDCLARILATIRHPLRLPAMPADGHCPVTRVRDLGRLTGFSDRVHGMRGGPLLLTWSSSTIPVVPSGDGWLGQKVGWGFLRDYTGPVLIRGGRIDAPGPLGFHRYIGAYGYHSGAGDGPHHRLLYLRGGLDTDGTDGGSTSEPSGIYVRSPGCYAIQADGEGVSGTIVFRVVRK